MNYHSENFPRGEIMFNNRKNGYDLSHAIGTIFISRFLRRWALRGAYKPLRKHKNTVCAPAFWRHQGENSFPYLPFWDFPNDAAGYLIL